MKTEQDVLQGLRTFYRGKNVLVTGGLGFLGSHTVKTLVELEASVCVLDVDTSQDRPSLVLSSTEGLGNKVRIVQGDVGEQDFVSKLFRENRFDVVFHYAAFSVIEKAAQGPASTVKTNALGWIHILEAARQAKHRPAALVLSSSDKVYGEMQRSHYTERTALRGVGVYEAAKLSADVFTQTYHQAFGLPCTAVRLCNLIGPADFNLDFRIIPRALRNIYQDEQPRAPELYFDSIGHWRDYAYVGDAARALLTVGCTPECYGEVFNMMGAKHISTPDVLRTLLATVARVESEFDDSFAEQVVSNGIMLTVRKPSSNVIAIKRQHLDASKLAAKTGFGPLVSFEEALERSVRFYRSYFAEKRNHGLVGGQRIAKDLTGLRRNARAEPLSMGAGRANDL